jgi:hypothetical protein
MKTPEDEAFEEIERIQRTRTRWVPVEKPQRTWVGLTNEDISEIVRGTHNTVSFVRVIEAKLKEKNNA